MSDDQLFRRILLLGFITLVPIGAWHRWKARTGERLDRRQEGVLLLITTRPIGIAGMLGLVAYLIRPAWMAWSSVPLPVWLRWTGVALGVIAGVLILWTFRNLGGNLTDTVVTRQQHTLVTTGPYRWVRHPFYLSAGLAMLANSLAAANWFLLVVGCVVFLALTLRARKEEQHLIARFGDDYRRYMQQTGRFLPRW